MNKNLIKHEDGNEFIVAALDNDVAIYHRRGDIFYKLPSWQAENNLTLYGQVYRLYIDFAPYIVMIHRHGDKFYYHKQLSIKEVKINQLAAAAKLIKKHCTEEDCWYRDEVTNEKIDICPFHNLESDDCTFTQLAIDDEPRYPELWDI